MKAVYFLCLTLILTACGGGGSDEDSISTSGVKFNGNSSPAVVDETNAKDIGVAAGESIQQGANSGALPVAIEIESEYQADYSELNSIVADHAMQLLLPSGVIVDMSEICVSGSAKADVPRVNSGPATIVISYSRCRLSGSVITASGTATVKFNDINNRNAGFSVRYSNFRISSPSIGSHTLNMFMECSSASAFSCTYSSDFVGSDGRTHRVSSISVSGSASSGYSGTATFYHSRHGRTSITISDISYGNCGNKPDGGSLSFTGTNGTSGTITFNSDCTVNGTWTTSTASGSF